LVEQPHIFDGNDRLVGECFQELNLCRCERARFASTRVQRSNEFSLLTKRSAQEGAKDAGKRRWEIILGANVGNMERAMLADPGKHWVINTELDAASRNRYRTNMSPRNHGVTFSESQFCIINPTHPRRALDNGVQNRLHVGGRPADDAEYLGC